MGVVNVNKVSKNNILKNEIQNSFQLTDRKGLASLLDERIDHLLLLWSLRCNRSGQASGLLLDDL